MPLACGTRLGPYRILAPLGAGGMGEVYRAEETRLDREVAIKVLPEHMAQNPEALARFEREAKAVAALSHPNILAIYDVGAGQGVNYAVTELLEGETLRSRLARGPIAWRKAVEIGVAVAQGLSSAHAKGVIHRDLKPENIFLTSDGRVKILDFGLARYKPASSQKAQSSVPTETETQPGTVMGTIGYISPEQVRGERVDAPGDIFSFGCLLYEMIAGQRAFGRATAGDTLAAILRDAPPPLAERDERISPELDRVIARCLEKNPGGRFHSAHDLAFALEEILGGAATTKPAPLPSSRVTGPGVHPAFWIATTAALLVLGTVLYWLNRPSGAIDSLAILPFTNASANPNAEYLSDGITENLINNLSQLPKLRVVPRSRAFRYKGRETDPQRVGRELNVRAVLTGRVVERGDSLNIQTELVDVARDSQIWGRQYGRKLSDIIAVQEEIAKEVSEKLRLRPTGEERKRLAKLYTGNIEAYRLYLQGRYFWNKRTPGGFEKAIQYFEQAIAKDPGYALAYSGLADSYNLLSFFQVLPPSETKPKAESAALKALEIDEGLAEAHASLALLKERYEWDWPGAEKEFRRAIALDPGNGIAHTFFALDLRCTGRFDEAVAEAQRAMALDPVSPTIGAIAALVYSDAGRQDEAIAQSRKTLEMDPNYAPGHLLLAQAYLRSKRFDEAVVECKTGLRLATDDPFAIDCVGRAYAARGNRAEAMKIVRQLTEMGKRRYISAWLMALVYAGLREKEPTLQWLEKAYEERSDFLTVLKVAPECDFLRSDARFSGLLRRINLAP